MSEKFLATYDVSDIDVNQAVRAWQTSYGAARVLANGRRSRRRQAALATRLRTMVVTAAADHSGARAVRDAAARRLLHDLLADDLDESVGGARLSRARSLSVPRCSATTATPGSPP